MFKRFIKWLKGYILGFLALFNTKNRSKAILADAVSPVEPATIEVMDLAPRRIAGTVMDITSALDNEAVELYGRSPFVK